MTGSTTYNVQYSLWSDFQGCNLVLNNHWDSRPYVSCWRLWRLHNVCASLSPPSYTTHKWRWEKHLCSSASEVNDSYCEIIFVCSTLWGVVLGSKPWGSMFVVSVMFPLLSLFLDLSTLLWIPNCWNDSVRVLLNSNPLVVVDFFHISIAYRTFLLK